MPFRIEGGASSAIDFDAALGMVKSDIQAALDEHADNALTRIKDTWYGGGNNPGRQHADGTETEADGRSNQGWEKSRAELAGTSAIVELRNGVEYSQYVHPSGNAGDPSHETEGHGPNGEWGESGGVAWTQFDHEMTKLEEKIQRIIIDAMADL